jgi:hypothetical protein
MVPLQAEGRISSALKNSHRTDMEPTELLLDDLEDFLLVKLLGQTLNSRQSLTTIALCVLISILIYLLG